MVEQVVTKGVGTTGAGELLGVACVVGRGEGVDEVLGVGVGVGVAIVEELDEKVTGGGTGVVEVVGTGDGVKTEEVDGAGGK